MAKAEVLENLKKINSELKTVKASIRRVRNIYISKQATKDSIQKICAIWFEKIEMQLTPLNLSEEIIDKYHNLFQKLLGQTLTNSRKTTYTTRIDNILNNFNTELLMEVMTSSVQIEQFKQLENILENITSKEKEYLKEAIGCANNDFFRASIVLGWSAAIHRIQKTIEQLGFDVFNEKSKEMKNITSGRYKRFSKVFTIHNLAELQTIVFDNDLLWVLEYWSLIDSNQHDRLSACFIMRNNSGHPGDAIISPENLVSFYSDLKTIIFDNTKFPPQE